MLSCLVRPGAAESKTLGIDKHRHLEITGTIRDLGDEADRLIALSEISLAPIFVTIDSYGGSVIGGLKFIRAIEQVKYRNVKVVCVVKDAAMSMGMHILAACTHRAAFSTSLLMWHPAYISVMMMNINQDTADRISLQLRILTEYLETQLKKALQIPEEEYNKYSKNEYIVLGADLDSHIAPKFLTIIDDVRIQ